MTKPSKRASVDQCDAHAREASQETPEYQQIRAFHSINRGLTVFRHLFGRLSSALSISSNSHTTDLKEKNWGRCRYRFQLGHLCVLTPDGILCYFNSYCSEALLHHLNSNVSSFSSILAHLEVLCSL